MLKQTLLASAVCLALIGCSKAPETATTSSPTGTETRVVETLSSAVDAGTLTYMKAQPTLSTMLAIDPEQVGGSYNHHFPDYSTTGMTDFQSAMAAHSAVVANAQAESDSEDIKRHQAIVANIFSYYAGSDVFSGGYIDTWAGHLPYIINQINGPLIDIPKLMQVQQSVTNLQDAEDYLERLQRYSVLVDQVLEKFAADKAKGIILPAKLHPKTLAYFDSFLGTTPDQHALVTTFQEKLAATELDQDKQAKLVERATALVSDVVYPAYQKARSVIDANQVDAPASDGIWAQPNGDDFYAHELIYLGDTSYTADQVHQIGLNEVERISAEMDHILGANGYTEGTVGERMLQLTTQPEFIYADTDDGRQQLLDDLNVEIENIMNLTDQYYGELPTQAVEVRRIPEVSEAGEAGGFYSPPSLDGTRPGIYWINLRDMSAVPSFGLKTLTYHEAVPGHHFQIALNMAQSDIGLLRQNAPYNAYVEGWALYSELVAKEMGMYQDDPFGDLGRLQAELYRAVRLVVDTGLHRKKWTRKKAIDYFHTTTGTSMTDVVAEVERYMAWPGQALGYKLGMLQFVELRNKAEKALGDKFDVRAFHDLILLPGARPMSIVRQDVESWIRSTQS